MEGEGHGGVLGERGTVEQQQCEGEQVRVKWKERKKTTENSGK